MFYENFGSHAIFCGIVPNLLELMEWLQANKLMHLVERDQSSSLSGSFFAGSGRDVQAAGVLNLNSYSQRFGSDAPNTSLVVPHSTFTWSLTNCSLVYLEFKI